MEDEGTFKLTGTIKQWAATIVSLMALLAVLGLMNTSSLTLVSDEFYCTYGEVFDDSGAAIIDSDDQDILDNAIITTDLEYEDGCDYPSVGTYTGTVTYDDQELTFTIIVE